MDGRQAIDLFKKQIIGILVDAAVKIFNRFWKKDVDNDLDN